jgi:hypothetical protein
MTAAGRKVAGAWAPKGSPLGRETAPESLRALLGCGVGARAPVAPSLALPAGLTVLGLVVLGLAERHKPMHVICNAR